MGRLHDIFPLLNVSGADLYLAPQDQALSARHRLGLSAAVVDLHLLPGPLGAFSMKPDVHPRGH